MSLVSILSYAIQDIMLNTPVSVVWNSPPAYLCSASMTVQTFTWKLTTLLFELLQVHWRTDYCMLLSLLPFYPQQILSWESLKINTNVKTDSILCLCNQQPSTIIIISITNGALEITHQHMC